MRMSHLHCHVKMRQCCCCYCAARCYMLLTSKWRLDQQRCGGYIYDKPIHDMQKHCWYRGKRAMPAARCAQRKQRLASKPEQNQLRRCQRLAAVSEGLHRTVVDLTDKTCSDVAALLCSPIYGKDMLRTPRLSLPKP